MVFSVLVADVEVREDCVFIRLRKEAVVSEGKDSGDIIQICIVVCVVIRVTLTGSPTG